MITTEVRTYLPGNTGEPDRKTILRYSGDPRGESDISDGALASLLDSVIDGGADLLTPRVCFARCGIRIDGDRVISEMGEFRSELLALHLEGCTSAVFFAATVGIGIDRAVTAASKLSPARALLTDAFGSERVEALCDLFEKEIGEELSSRGLATVSRYSPGYGDFSLEYQKQIITGLQCQKYIGLTLNSCLIMTPAKSVTAVIGVRKGAAGENASDRCSRCSMTECPFRNTDG